MPSSVGIVNFIDALVKPLYVHGIDFIQASQRNFKHWEPLLAKFYRAGDPWVIYFFAFPLIYYNSMRMGLRILWAAAITEYVNIIFKLLVHGHRPFWWIFDSPYHITAPRIAQFPLTCETTPGTPMLQSMVTSCVTFILAQHYCRCKGLSMQCNWMQYVGVWGAHYVFQGFLLVSGAFYANTFPHQAILGTLMGAMMARRFARTNVLEISFAGFTWMMFFMVTLYTMINGALWILGYDPTWAGSKASMACMKLRWMDIYSDVLAETTIRASGIIMGMGLATRFFTTNALKVTDGCLPKVKLVHGVVGICVITIFDLFIQPPFAVAPSVYYIFVFVKYTIPPILIITDIPFITGLAKLISSALVDEDPRCFMQLGGDPMIPENPEMCAPSPLNAEECCGDPAPDPCCQTRPRRRTRSRKRH